MNHIYGLLHSILNAFLKIFYFRVGKKMLPVENEREKKDNEIPYGPLELISQMNIVYLQLFLCSSGTF